MSILINAALNTRTIKSFVFSAQVLLQYFSSLLWITVFIIQAFGQMPVADYQAYKLLKHQNNPAWWELFDLEKKAGKNFTSQKCSKLFKQTRVDLRSNQQIRGGSLCVIRLCFGAALFNLVAVLMISHVC